MALRYERKAFAILISVQIAWIARILLTLAVLLGQSHICSPIHLSESGSQCQECLEDGSAQSSVETDDCGDCCEEVTCEQPESRLSAETKTIPADQPLILPAPLEVPPSPILDQPVSRPPPEETQSSPPTDSPRGRAPPCQSFA